MITITTNIPTQNPKIKTVPIGQLRVGSYIQLCPNIEIGRKCSLDTFNRYAETFVKGIIVSHSSDTTTILRFSKSIDDDTIVSFGKNTAVYSLQVKNLELEAQFTF